MTDKIEVPRDLMEELRDCAAECAGAEKNSSVGRERRFRFYVNLMEQCDDLLAQHTDNDGEPLPSKPDDLEAMHRDARRMIAMVDAAMVEMSNIHPPIRRSECERLIVAAIAAEKREG